MDPLSPTRAVPASPLPGQECQTEKVQAQCGRRELLRRLLHESRQEVSLLSKKVGELQKKLAQQQKEKGGLMEFSPSVAVNKYELLIF